MATAVLTRRPVLARDPQPCDFPSVPNTLTPPDSAENLSEKIDLLPHTLPKIDKTTTLQRKLNIKTPIPPFTRSNQEIERHGVIEEYQYLKGKLYIAPHAAVPAEIVRAVDEEIAPRVLGDIRALGLDCAIPKLCIAGHKKTALKPVYVVLCNDHQEQKKLKKQLGSRHWKDIFAKHNVKLMVLLDLKAGPKASMNISADDEPTLPPMLSISGLVPEHLQSACGILIRRVEGEFATLGGLILVQGKLYGLTTGHNFCPNPSNSRLDTTQSEPSIDQAGDSSLSAVDQASISSAEESSIWSEDPDSASITERSASSRSPSAFSLPPDDLRVSESYQHIGKVDIYKWGLSTFQSGNSNFPKFIQGDYYSDWALIEIHPAFLRQHSGLTNTIMQSSPVEDSNHGDKSQSTTKPSLNPPTHSAETKPIPSKDTVKVQTGRSLYQNGTLEAGLTTIILSKMPFIVQQITLGLPLENGDSGAWVFREEELLGMIIAGSGLFPWAYMIPIKAMLNDIEETLNTETTIPSTAQIQQIVQGENQDIYMPPPIEIDLATVNNSIDGVAELCDIPSVYPTRIDPATANNSNNGGAKRLYIPPVDSHEDEISHVTSEQVRNPYTLAGGNLLHKKNPTFKLPTNPLSNHSKDEKDYYKEADMSLRIFGILTDCIKVVQLTPNLMNSLSRPQSSNTDTSTLTIDIRRFDLWCKVFKGKLDAESSNVLLPELGELLEIILINAAREFKAIESILEARMHLSKFVLFFQGNIFANFTKTPQMRSHIQRFKELIDQLYSLKPLG